MDTTYFGKKYGYMIFKARFPKLGQGKNLLRYKVDYETNSKYKEGFEFLIAHGRKVVGIVCDGRKGLLNGFGPIPTQMCIFHMKQILTRYLTKKPKLIQNISLKNISEAIGIYPKEDVLFALEVWNKDNTERLNSRNDDGNYIHVKTRKAYFCIKRKLDSCYIFDVHRELLIPNTTNSLEAINSHIKTKCGIHRGLSESKKDKFISYYLWSS